MTIGTYLRSRDGLMAGEERRARMTVFVVLILIAASVTFLMLGFVGIGTSDHYLAYLQVLLGPVSVAALLLGWKYGTLTGLFCGTFLLVHSRLTPLDPIEGYLVVWQNSVFLYALVGFLLGLVFEVIRRRSLAGTRRHVAVAIACLLTSSLSTALLGLLMNNDIPEVEILASHLRPGDTFFQMACDCLLMLACCALSGFLVKHHEETKTYACMPDIFHSNLFAVLLIGYLMASSVVFLVLTAQEKTMADVRMRYELNFLVGQLEDRWNQYQYLLKGMDEGRFTEDDLKSIQGLAGSQELLDGFDKSNGTIVVVSEENTVIFSNNPLFSPGNKAFGKQGIEPVKQIVEDDVMCMVPYYEGTNDIQLGYARAAEAVDNCYVIRAMPFSTVFSLRRELIRWTSLITLALLVIVDIMVAYLLRRVVMDPINGTNESLGKIMVGDFDETVCEVGSVEFATLSAGINATVDALKGWIGEAQRSMERELATARAIQEGALPRDYPAFPGVNCVDLYASMDAARDVGGDFYDFFTVDDHTVCFLIADVSGKGIPGALFMMSAKTEIQDHLSKGVEPARAIAEANAYLCEHNDAGMFVTVWAATLDWTTGLLTYVNAGHNFPLLRRGHNGAWEWLNKKCGLFLGTFETAKYRQRTLMLEPGDELLLYTDGVNEAFSADDMEYGNDRLEAFLRAHADVRPRELVRALRADVAAWAEGAEQSDDITILAVEYDG
ncbi:MAG: SpoIIE family protein phosphatase [Atopobiaceae bacterium]|nr:SpoIIE family protein phosphatase [Atopobiaceae bacterium]